MLKIENNQIVRYVPLVAEINRLTDSPCMMVRVMVTTQRECNYHTVNLDLRKLSPDQLAVLIGKAKREFDRR